MTCNISPLLGVPSPMKLGNSVALTEARSAICSCKQLKLTSFVVNVPSKIYINLHGKNWHGTWKWSHLLQEVVQTYSNWVSTRDWVCTMTKSEQEVKGITLATSVQSEMPPPSMSIEKSHYKTGLTGNPMTGKRSLLVGCFVLGCWFHPFWKHVDKAGMDFPRGTYKSPANIPASFA